MRTYVVQIGDTPATIANRFAGCPKCSIDLLASNPTKPTVGYANGYRTFARLRVGEVLNLPPKWLDDTLDRLPKSYFDALPSPYGLGVANVATPPSIPQYQPPSVLYPAGTILRVTFTSNAPILTPTDAASLQAYLKSIGTPWVVQNFVRQASVGSFQLAYAVRTPVDTSQSPVVGAGGASAAVDDITPRTLPTPTNPPSNANPTPSGGGGGTVKGTLPPKGTQMQPPAVTPPMSTGKKVGIALGVAAAVGGLVLLFR